MSSVCSVTPRTVPTSTPPIKTRRPRTIDAAASDGLNLWRTSTPTSGLKHTASTAANVIGRRISLTKASAMTMKIARDDETDEAPGPHPDARDPAQGRGDVVRARLGRPGSVGRSTRRRTRR